MKLLLRWIVNAIALIGIAQYLEGVSVDGFYAALVTALVLGLINAVIRPVLVFLTLPITVLTLGFFTLVINGALFWFGSTIVEGFDVTGYWPAFWGALAMSIVSFLVSSALKKD